MTEALRWSKLVWADFENDIPLKMCSLAAQGVWWRLLAYMHRAEPCGHLTIAGKPMSLRQISVLVGYSEAELEPLLQELAGSDVFSRNESKVIFSRRMVREAEERATGAKHGASGGNPTLTKSASARPMRAGARFRREDNPALVRAVFQRAAGSCEACGTPAWVDVAEPPGSFIVRRRDPRGAKVAENFIGLCRPCHTKRNLEAPVPGITPVSDAGVEQRRVDKRRVEKKGTAPNGAVVGSDDPTGLPVVVRFPTRGAAEEQAAFDAWNALAAETNVHAAQKLDSDRRAKLRARLNECDGLTGWMIALDKVRGSLLWQGKKGTGWTASFDDILSKTKFRRLMEGGYTDHAPPAAAAQPESGLARILRRERERAEAEASTVEGFAS